MKKVFQSLLFISTMLTALLIFIGSTMYVVAQGFIEPSSQAPLVNVLDFLNQSEGPQARNGKLQINKTSHSFTGTEPVIYSYGNAVLEGTANFDWTTNQSTLSVNTDRNEVVSGFNMQGKKFAINPSAGMTALYAESSNNIAISAIADRDNSYAVFGQTVSASAINSAGVRGLSTNAAGAGIYAYQQSSAACDDKNPVLCLTARFTGNLFVVASTSGSQGIITGDGRGVTTGWTLYDTQSASNPSQNISFKTITELDITPTENITVNGLTSGESFISMSVMVDGKPYNPAVGQLHVEFLSSTKQFRIINNSAAVVDKVVIHAFYSMSKALSILNAQDQYISSIDVLATQNPLYNGDAQFTDLKAQISGELGGENVNWDILQLNDTSCAGGVTICGSISETDPQGKTATYTSPTTVAVPNNQLKIKASLADDPSSNATILVNVYRIQITPITEGYKKLSTNLFGLDPQTHQFIALASCPAQINGGTCPPSVWSLVSTYENQESISSLGLYRSPDQIVDSNLEIPWKAHVKVQFQGKDQHFDSYKFELIPDIFIRTSQDFSGGNYWDWTANPSNLEMPNSNNIQPQSLVNRLICYGGSNNGNACTSNANCTGGGTCDSIKVCTGGSNNGVICSTDANCTGGGTCRSTRRIKIQLLALSSPQTPDNISQDFRVDLMEPQVDSAGIIGGGPATVLYNEGIGSPSFGTTQNITGQTNVTTDSVYYYPPTTFLDGTDASPATTRAQWIRRLKITYTPKGITTKGVKYLDIYIGRGEDKVITTNISTGTSFTVKSIGFDLGKICQGGSNRNKFCSVDADCPGSTCVQSPARKIQAICKTPDCATATKYTITYPIPAEGRIVSTFGNPIANQGVMTCGSLKINTMAEPSSCRTDDNAVVGAPALCSLSTSITYTGASSVCSQTVYVQYQGDLRLPLNGSLDKLMLTTEQPLICTGCGTALQCLTRCGNPSWPTCQLGCPCCDI